MELDVGETFESAVFNKFIEFKKYIAANLVYFSRNIVSFCSEINANSVRNLAISVFNQLKIKKCSNFCKTKSIFCNKWTSKKIQSQL